VASEIVAVSELAAAELDRPTRRAKLDTASDDIGVDELGPDVAVRRVG
jgi:hypothetical protein